MRWLFMICLICKFVQYSGPSEDALAYVGWLKEDERYNDILVQISNPISKHAFPRLKLRYKPSLVQASYLFCYSFVSFCNLKKTKKLLCLFKKLDYCNYIVFVIISNTLNGLFSYRKLRVFF